MSEPDDDTTLAEAAAAGDRNAFETLLSRHYETVYKIAFKWCGNPTDAEDISQIASIKLARHIGSFRGESAFTSWLYRLVINVAKDWQRQQKPSTPIESAAPVESPESTASAEQTLYAQQVMAEVQRLPEDKKAALLLVAGEGLSHREAAEVMGCKESTISWRIHQARKKLAQRFGREHHVQ